MIIYCSRNEQRSIYSKTIAFNIQSDISVKHCYASKNKMTIVYTCLASDDPHTTSPIALVLFMGRREFIVWQRSGHGPNWLFVIILLWPILCALVLPVPICLSLSPPCLSFFLLARFSLPISLFLARHDYVPSEYITILSPFQSFRCPFCYFSLVMLIYIQSDFNLHPIHFDKTQAKIVERYRNLC